MISEGSCDTEDWSNDVKIEITGISSILQCIKIENSYFKLSKYFTLLLCF